MHPILWPFLIFIGIFSLVKKLVDALFSPLERKAEEAAKQKERDKVFGSQNHEIEIYDPNDDAS